MKISLVGSFNLAHGYLGAANALKRQGHEVDFIPAALYHSEHREKHVQMTIDDLTNQSPDIVLWWRAENLSAEELGFVKSKIPGKHIMYSWDDPHQWEMHPEMPSKCKFLDAAFTCCEGSVFDYIKNGCEAFYCPPGFDPEVHYPEESEEHKCDVSLVCTNLYDGPITRYPHLSRKKLMDNIIKNCPDFDIRIYGFDDLKQHYPNHYKGWLPFEESRKVFYNSKINISTHIRPDGFMYINERVAQVMGSGGLLLVDKVNGIEKLIPDGCCVYMDTNDLPGQIRGILDNYENYGDIKNRGHEFAKSRLSWDNWAETVLAGIEEVGQ